MFHSTNLTSELSFQFYITISDKLVFKLYEMTDRKELIVFDFSNLLPLNRGESQLRVPGL